MADDNIFKVLEFDAMTILNSILVIILAYILVRVLSFILIRFSERVNRYRFSVKMMLPILKFSIYGIALYHISGNILNLSPNQLLAISGLIGAGIGFGLKDLFADVIGGLVITLEKPYQVGDKIKIGEYYGEVSDIGIRATKLVTPDDNLVFAPNFMIFTQPVSNANAGGHELLAVIDLYIDSDSDAASAMKILKEAMITSKYVYVSKKRPYTVLLKDYPFYRRLRGKAYVNDLRYEFEFQSDVTRRAWDEFSRKGISAPKVNIMEAVTSGSGEIQ